MPFDISQLELPEYEKYSRTPRNQDCIQIDTKRIIAMILGGEKDASIEGKISNASNKILIEGSYAIVLHYKREKNNLFYPVVTLGFDIIEHEIMIRHIQGMKQNRVGYRFNAGFDTFTYFIELIRQNFTLKGIRVYLPQVPTNLEATSYGAQSPIKYQELQKKLEHLNASIEQ